MDLINQAQKFVPYAKCFVGRRQICLRKMIAPIRLSYVKFPDLSPLQAELETLDKWRDKRNEFIRALFNKDAAIIKHERESLTAALTAIRQIDGYIR
ncbi:MAG: hypothetical protein LBQ91_04895 [Oscillospiraceae bacterium]|jgi:hypothetical protein|nr:hypothetical protein [Oscillospiraceae bacterium]